MGETVKRLAAVMNGYAKLIQWLGIPTAVAAAALALWTMLGWADARPVLERDIRPLWSATESNSRSIHLMRWQLLEAQRSTRGLSVTELSEFCTIGQILLIRGEGCR